jgi:hypothetical protein
MAHFEKKKSHPLFSREAAERKTLDGLQRAETLFLHMFFEILLYSFEYKIMILLRNFHMVTIDG